MASQLFQYAILFHPKVTKDGNGNETQPADAIITNPTFVLGKDDKEVGIKAARSIPDEYLDKLDQVEIIISPF